MTRQDAYYYKSEEYLSMYFDMYLLASCPLECILTCHCWSQWHSSSAVTNVGGMFFDADPWKPAEDQAGSGGWAAGSDRPPQRCRPSERGRDHAEEGTSWRTVSCYNVFLHWSFTFLFPFWRKCIVLLVHHCICLLYSYCRTLHTFLGLSLFPS